jgi:hypothetical protein
VSDDKDDKQLVEVDIRGAKIFVTTYDSVGPYGPWVCSSQSYQEVANTNIDPTELGARVLVALSKTRRGLPMPDYRTPEHVQDRQRMLEKYGVKSEKEWNRGVVSCSVWRSADTLKVTPQQRSGQGFSSLLKEVIELVAPTPAELGEAIQKCLKIAAGAPDIPDDPPGYGHT